MESSFNENHIRKLCMNTEEDCMNFCDTMVNPCHCVVSCIYHARHLHDMFQPPDCPICGTTMTKSII